MSFRTKLIGLFTLTVATVVFGVSVVMWVAAGRTFEALERERTEVLFTHFRREFDRRAAEVVERLHAFAGSEALRGVAFDLARGDPGYSQHVELASALAASHDLELLDIVSADGTIISSAHWPARFGYKKKNFVEVAARRSSEGAFLVSEEIPEGTTLALVAVRPVAASGRTLYVAGGLRLDQQFLASLVLPDGVRAVLYCSPAQPSPDGTFIDAKGPLELAQLEKLSGLIERLRVERAERVETIAWSRDPAESETLHALPLLGLRQEILGALLVGSSRRALASSQQFILRLALVAAAGGVLLGGALAFWAARPVTRPIEELSAAARQVASGDLQVRVEPRGAGEIAQLALTFNQMTSQLAEQRERLVQTERVAAWRELARRLAHELKNPLFPLQITVENLQRARLQSQERFDEVFHESTVTLLAELQKLKTIVGRFSDFARMPQPELKRVDVNELLRDALKLFEAQLAAPGRAPVRAECDLAPHVGVVEADPDLLHRAFSNLILNAIDAMPEGGRLLLKTCEVNGGVRIEVSDTGAGLTREEAERVFTPYYTSKPHGTGLGLAIVQSVVSDHAGKIVVESEPAHGTTFRIDLPAHPPRGKRKGAE